MPEPSHPLTRTVLLGFGAFGRLAATHLSPHTDLAVIDPRLEADEALAAEVRASGARPGTIEADLPHADAVILAVPVQRIEEACGVIGPSKDEVEAFCGEVVPAIAEWRADALEPYGTEAFNRKLDGAEQQRMFVVFSKLGALNSFATPRMTGYSTSTGSGTFVTVDIDATFSRGKARMRLTLRSSGGELKLQGVDIQSPVFGDPSASPSAVQQI